MYHPKEKNQEQNARQLHASKMHTMKRITHDTVHTL